MTSKIWFFFRVREGIFCAVGDVCWSFTIVSQAIEHHQVSLENLKSSTYTEVGTADVLPVTSGLFREYFPLNYSRIICLVTNRCDIQQCVHCAVLVDLCRSEPAPSQSRVMPVPQYKPVYQTAMSLKYPSAHYAVDRLLRVANCKCLREESSWLNTAPLPSGPIHCDPSKDAKCNTTNGSDYRHCVKPRKLARCRREPLRIFAKKRLATQPPYAYSPNNGTKIVGALPVVAANGCRITSRIWRSKLPQCSKRQ